jgi:hypothetical protein
MHQVVHHYIAGVRPSSKRCRHFGRVGLMAPSSFIESYCVRTGQHADSRQDPASLGTQYSDVTCKVVGLSARLKTYSDVVRSAILNH